MFWPDLLSDDKKYFFEIFIEDDIIENRFPVRAMIDYYAEQDGKPFPNSYNDLDTYHGHIARSKVDLYPKGGGLKTTEYKKIFEPQKLNQRGIKDWIGDYEGNLEPGLQKHKEGVSTGWSGPVISFLARIN